VKTTLLDNIKGSSSEKPPSFCTKDFGLTGGFEEGSPEGQVNPRLWDRNEAARLEGEGGLVSR